MPRCDKCGFLATRHHTTRQLLETEQRKRESGRTVEEPDTFEMLLVCFAGAAALHKEAGGREQPDAVLAVIQKERECDSFAPWIQGYTPKEHKEMLDNKALRDWQAEEREKERAWQQEMRQSEREYQERQKMADRRWNLTMVVLAATFSAIVSVGSFIAGRLWK